MPCAWICYLFKRMRIHRWVAIVSTLGFVFGAIVAYAGDRLETMYWSQGLVLGCSFAIGFIYCLRDGKKQNQWGSDDS